MTTERFDCPQCGREYDATHEHTPPERETILRGEGCFPGECGERRQSSPEYRERVADRANELVRRYGHDYDDAAEFADYLGRSVWAANLPENGQQYHKDVAILLRRRAETVKGMRVR